MARLVGRTYWNANQWWEADRDERNNIDVTQYKKHQTFYPRNIVL